MRARTKDYRIGNRNYNLDPQIRALVKQYNITTAEIDKEYQRMRTWTPGLSIVTYNHAAYQVYLRKTGQ